MPTPVVMPQMGESIAEGTLVRWIKKPGDHVDRDEPLFEISTDKVDAEIPSPAAGVLLDIRVHEGETVPVDSVVATIGEPGDAVAGSPPPATSGNGQLETTGRSTSSSREVPAKAPRKTTQTAQQPARKAAPEAKSPARGPSDGPKLKSSPVVRRIARDNDVDIAEIPGTGIGGRVTKHDILDFIEEHPAGASVPAAPSKSVRAYGPNEPVDIQPLSIVRRKIADHMVLSRQTSAHVHTVFHVNFTHVERLRQQHKADYERQGARLTVMPFIVKAVIDALNHRPVVNASLDGNNIVYKKDVNIGIAVALETGLIVPVIKQASELSLIDLSRAIQDLADRARAKQLKPEEVHAGTFTITNPGKFGAQFGLPIINQPQVAILGVGTIEKRPIVIDDAIAIRTMGYLALGFDHRLIDGAVADEFMADIKQGLEQFDPSQI